MAKKGKGLLGLFGRARAEDAPGEPPRPDMQDIPERPSRLSPEEQARQAENEARLREVRLRQEEENKVQASSFKLYEVFAMAGRLPPELDERGRMSLAAMTDSGDLPDREQRMWLLGFDRIVRGLPQYSAALPLRVGPKGEALTPEPADAMCHIRVSADGMAAYIFMLPPRHGGQPMQHERALSQLREAGITHGILAERVTLACRQGRYLTLIEAARGTRARDGQDGEVLDYYKRSNDIDLSLREDDTVDFKNLGWLQTAEEGDIICEILPPSLGKPGVNVRGQTVHARDGRPARIPQGQGTLPAEDGALLVAAFGGVVTFQRDHFRVDPLLIIRGDVDTAIGNLDVIGSVMVHGDVRAGFEVRATEHVTVRGLIEGATVAAGQNVQAGIGISGRAVVSAGGGVLAGFVEHATVEAGGSLISNSIVNSTVVCGDAAEAMGGRGVIVGGSITAHNRVQAQVIGHRDGRSIEINLGNSAAFVAEKRELLQKRGALKDEMAEKETNIAWLESRENLAWDEQTQLDELRQGLPMLKMQVNNLNRHLSVMNRRQDLNTGCILKAGIIYPPVELMLGGADATLRSVLYEAEVVLRDGKILEKDEIVSAPDTREKLSFY